MTVAVASGGGVRLLADTAIVTVACVTLLIKHDILISRRIIKQFLWNRQQSQTKSKSMLHTKLNPWLEIAFAQGAGVGVW